MQILTDEGVSTYLKQALKQICGTSLSPGPAKLPPSFACSTPFLTARMSPTVLIFPFQSG
jgi:hypothetical protein